MDATTVNLILGILAPILTALIGWAAAAINRKAGLEIDAKHREALQSALLNGARLAMSKQLTRQAAVDLVLSYVKDSVPGALEHFTPSAKVLTDLAEAKLEQAASEKAKDLASGAVDALTDALRKAGAS